MKCYIVQHGDALSKEDNPDRPLSEDGRDDIQALARKLQHLGIQPKRIYHSGKLRAQQTADIIAARLGCQQAVQALEGIGPNDDAAGFAAKLKNISVDVLIASHMPFVQKLCNALLGDDAIDFHFSPGKLVCLDIREGNASLDWQRLTP